MNKFLAGLTLAAMAAAGVSTAAMARPEGPRPPHHAFPDFAELDTDGNGSVTMEELRARRVAEVEGLDANGDGLISAEELANAEIARMTERANDRAAKMVERMDTNGDGLLSAAELAVPAGGPGEHFFERIDADGDGAITQAEVDAAHEKMRERGPRHGERGRD